MSATGCFSFRGRRGIGDEDVTPMRRTRAGSHVIHIKNRVVVGELFLKNTGRYVSREFLRGHFVQQRVLVMNGQRVEPYGTGAGCKGRKKRKKEEPWYKGNT